MNTSDTKIYNLQIRPVNFDRNDISWSCGNSGTCQFAVFRQENTKNFNADEDVLEAIVEDTCYSDRNIQPGTLYAYRVALLKDGEIQYVSKCITCVSRKRDLELIANRNLITVKGCDFELTWDKLRGGEIVEIRQYDGNSWVKLNDDRTKTVPDFTIYDKSNHKTTQLCRQKTVRENIVRNTADEIVLSFELKVKELIIENVYYVFKEGIIFSEINIRKGICGTPHNAQGGYPEELLEYFGNLSFSLGIGIGNDITENKFLWSACRRGCSPPAYNRKSTDKVTDSNRCLPVAMADYSLNKDAGFTNHFEVFIEDTPPRGAHTYFGKDRISGRFKFEWQIDGRCLKDMYFLCFDLGFFRTRWGICLSSARKASFNSIHNARKNNMTGKLIFHIPLGTVPDCNSRDAWPWNIPPLPLIKKPCSQMPPKSLVDEAEKKNAVIILHQGWMKCGGSNGEPPADYIPREEKKLKSFIDYCHKRNVPVLLYMRAIEKYALYQSKFLGFLKHNFDGLYVDWNTPFSSGYSGSNELHIPAYSHFLFTKELRRQVGDNGILISHSGGCPAYLALSTFDACVFGEARIQKSKLLASMDDFLYYSFSASVAPGFLFRHFKGEHKKLVAHIVASGAIPDIMIDPGKIEEKNECLKELLLLCKIFSHIPFKNVRIYNPLKENINCISVSNKSFYPSIYFVNKDMLILTVVNLGKKGKSILKINNGFLGLAGRYKITEIREECKNSLICAKSSSLEIRTDYLAQYEYKGYVFEKLRMR